MALRKVFEIACDEGAEYGTPAVMVRVYRDSEWQEYRIRTYRHGVLQKDSDTFESDKAEAIRTANSIMWRLYPPFAADRSLHHAAIEAGQYCAVITGNTRNMPGYAFQGGFDGQSRFLFDSDYDGNLDAPDQILIGQTVFCGYCLTIQF